jgi:hypothetical protein
MRLAERVARVDEKMNICRILVGRPEGKRSMWRYRLRWEDNIKIDLREIGWGSMDRKALVNTVMKFRVP